MKILPLVFCLAVSPLLAQNNILRGVVTYQNTGAPVKGVKISELGMGVSGVSDDNGVFELKFPGRKPGEVVELFARLEGHEIVGRASTTSFDEALRSDPAQLARLVMARSADKKKREDELRTVVNLRSEEEKKLLNAMLERLDDPALSINERQALQDSIIRLNRDIETLAANRDELVKRLAETDLSQASGLVKKAFAEFEKGNVKAALALLPDDKLDAFMKKAREAFRLGVENYMVKARFLVADNQHKEAETCYLKAIAADSANVANLKELADFFHNQSDYPQAVRFYQKALTVAKTESERAAVLTKMGYALYRNRSYAEADTVLRQALKIQRVLVDANPEALFPDLAMTLLNLGAVLADNHFFSEADTLVRESLKINRVLAEKNPDTFLPALAMSLNNMGLLLNGLRSYTEAEAAYREALKIRRALAEKTPDIYLSDVAFNLNNMGVVLINNEAYAEADTAFREALKTYRSLAEKNPGAFLPGVAWSLNNLGALLSETQSYAEADTVIREALKIRRALAEKNPDAFLPDLAMSLMNLGALLFKTQSYAEAEAAYREALKNYRALAEKTPDAFLPSVAMTLDNLGNLLSDNQAYAEAEAAYREALKIYESLLSKHPENHTLQSQLSSRYGNLAWNCLLANHPQQAQEAARKGLLLDPAQEWINSNLALAFLFQGKWTDAEALYTGLKDKPFDGQRTWRQVFLEDLDAMEKAGVTHPDMAKARALLRE